MFDYVVYDVFTNAPFGGNQLAVFTNAADIPEDKLQKIAAEFNFSEVTFVYPPQDPAHVARVRIFTPTSEVDFAGHPVIGTVIALSKLGYTSPMILELGIGPLPCEVKGSTARFTTSRALDIISKPDPSLVAKALGLTPGAIKTDTHGPLQASLGLPFTIVELDSRLSLSNCQPNIDAIRQAAKLYPAGLDFAIFAYVREGYKVTSRMFAPLDNIPEDPATGSASATLAALLTEQLGEAMSLSFLQGEDMGRSSYIKATTTNNPINVTIEGQAVQTMAGQFIL